MSTPGISEGDVIEVKTVVNTEKGFENSDLEQHIGNQYEVIFRNRNHVFFEDDDEEVWVFHPDDLEFIE